MNYIILKNDDNLPICIEKRNIGNFRIIFLSARYKFIKNLLLNFFAPCKSAEEKSYESFAILQHLFRKISNVAICASAEKTLSILKMFAEQNVDFFITSDNPYIISKALEEFGITVFVSSYVTADLLLYYDGDMPQYSSNTFVADFSGKHIQNKLNTRYINDITFKTYNAICELIGNLQITDIF